MSNYYEDALDRQYDYAERAEQQEIEREKAEAAAAVIRQRTVTVWSRRRGLYWFEWRTEASSNTQVSGKFTKLSAVCQAAYKCAENLGLDPDAVRFRGPGFTDQELAKSR